MGWGTTFSPEIYLSKVTFDSKWEIEDYIKDKETSINFIRNKLLIFAASSPKDICPDEWKDDIVSYLTNELRDLLDLLEELTIEKAKINLLLNHVIENDLNVNMLKT